MNKFTVLLFSIWMVGCATANMKAWFGHSKYDLVSAWGVPDRSEKLDNGKQVLTWDARNGYGQIICNNTFTIDSNDKVDGFSTTCP